MRKRGNNWANIWTMVEGSGHSMEDVLLKELIQKNPIIN